MSPSSGFTFWCDLGCLCTFGAPELSVQLLLVHLPKYGDSDDSGALRSAWG
ncbi:MAG: hypothetical protein AAFZ18_05490 [Myxococcota bacterium]